MLAALLIVLALPVSAATTITVTSAGDAINGDVTSVDALRGNPGPDGISLREAMSAARTGAVIEFAPALANSTISIGSALPEVTKRGVTIRGFALGDGSPAITISGAAQTQNSPGAFIVRASDFTLSGLRIQDVVRSRPVIVEASRVVLDQMVFRHSIPGADTAVWVTNGEPDRDIRGVTITRSEFDRWDGCAIRIDSMSTNGTITDVLIDRNTIARGGGSGCGISLGTNDLSSSSSQSRVVVSRNTISGYINEALGIGLGTQGTSATVEDVLIYFNDFTGSSYGIEAVGSGQNGTTRRTSIVANRFAGNEHGVTITNIGLPQRPPSSGNARTHLLIAANRFTDNSKDGILLEGGGSASSGNLLDDVTVVNNVMARNGDGAIVIAGGGLGAQGNVVDDVVIVNNTIVQEASHALTMTSNLGSAQNNQIVAVRVINTIAATTDSMPFFGEQPLSIQSTVVAADPLFVAPAQDDYRLQAGSPAVNTADVNAAPLTDIACGSRGNAPDIGAHERGAAMNVHLALVRRGNGSGDVFGDTTRVPCEDLGFARIDGYAAGSVVALTAVPEHGSFFAGWGGDDDCLDGVVTLSASTLCTVTFERPDKRRAVR